MFLLYEYKCGLCHSRESGNPSFSVLSRGLTAVSKITFLFGPTI
ncbi:hypothetical protein [Rickettsia asembonensis]|nr:hypothetical protein [Rickettsia asembonensis]